MSAVDPDEERRRADEMEDDVGEAEERGCDRDRLDGVLDASLDVDAERLLESDEVGGVAHRCLDVLAADAANQLVDAVEKAETRDLAKARVGM